MAREGSGFTLLFEAFALALIEREMPVNRAAEMLGEYPQRIWTIFNHWVGLALEQDQLEPIEHLGLDETSAKKGHHYVTLGVDLQRGRVIHVAAGKDSKAVASIAKKIRDKGGDCAQVSQVSMDLSPAFMAGVSASFADAQITFDKFHIVKLLVGSSLTNDQIFQIVDKTLLDIDVIDQDGRISFEEFKRSMFDKDIDSILNVGF